MALMWNESVKFMTIVLLCEKLRFRIIYSSSNKKLFKSVRTVKIPSCNNGYEELYCKRCGTLYDFKYGPTILSLPTYGTIPGGSAADSFALNTQIVVCSCRMALSTLKASCSMDTSRTLYV